MGLAWDAFDMVDEYLAETAGSTAAILERIGGGIRTAAYVGAVMLSMMPFPFTAIAADIGASALEGDMPPELVAARKFIGLASLTVFTAFASKVAFSATKAAIQYVRNHGLRATFRNLYDAGVGLAKRAWNYLRKPKTGAACGCFVQGTLVWTEDGLAPIESIQTGDYVLAYDETTGTNALAPVTDVTVVAGSALLDITLLSQNGTCEVIRATDEHPFAIEAAGARRGEWRRADQLRPGDRIRSNSEQTLVLSIAFTGDRATVHNLSVGGVHTFYVGLDGASVHNMSFLDCLPRWVRSAWHDMNDIQYHYNKHGRKMGFESAEE